MDHNRELWSRLRDLARAATLVQLEEYSVAQYFSAVPAGVPIVFSPHNIDANVLREIFTAAAQTPRERFRASYGARRVATTERRAAQRATATLCVTDHDRDYFRRHGASDVIVVPNGVDDELLGIPAAPAANERVFFFGAFYWPPNLHGARRFLTDVWPRVVQDRPNARLRIAGWGSVDRLSEMGRATPNVEVIGYLPDLRQELESTRVVVAPIWIGGGTRIKVLEALAAGRPVIGPSVGVERIGFIDGEQGFITDDPRDFASAIVRVIEDDELAGRLCKGARDLGKQFRWSECTRPAVDLYRRLMLSDAAWT